jgi:phenylacetate-CoA ligase
VEGWRLKRLRCGGQFQKYFDRFQRNQAWTPEEQHAYQLAALREILRHCQETVPFYRAWFKQAGFAVEDLKELSDLKHLPVLSKSTVLENPGQFCSETVRRQDIVRLHTSGTTGSPLVVEVTRSSLQAYQAAVARHRSWFGVHPGMSHATFNGRSILQVRQRAAPYWVHNHSGRQTLFSLYHMREDTLDAYFRELSRIPRDSIDGYPSSVSVLARFMNERRLRLPWQPRAVFLSSETLAEEQRNAIAEAFQAPISEFYGMAEQAACASQCPQGHFHFDPEIGCVEFLPLPGQPGMARIVCTGLTNRAMPLVRYDTQDLVSLSGPAGHCPCGRSGQIVERIDGRVESFVVTPDGARIGRLDHVYKGLEGICESQIVQTQIDCLLVKVVPASSYGPAQEARLRQALATRLGSRMSIQIVCVPAIARTSSGKLRAVISELPPAGNALVPTPGLSQSP